MIADLALMNGRDDKLLEESIRVHRSSGSSVKGVVRDRIRQGSSEIAVVLLSPIYSGICDGLPGEVLIFEKQTPLLWWLVPWARGPSYTLRVQILGGEIPDRIPNYFELYDPMEVRVLDLNGDDDKEILVLWESGPVCGSGWLKTLQIVYYDEFSKSYKPIISLDLHTTNQGGVIVENVDQDPFLELIEYDYFWSYEDECHYCPHRYKIKVSEFDGHGIRRDWSINRGNPIRTDTTLREDDPNLERLILNYVKRYVQTGQEIWQEYQVGE